MSDHNTVVADSIPVKEPAAPVVLETEQIPTLLSQQTDSSMTFTADEHETLLSIIDTVVPSVSPEQLVELAPTLGADLDGDTIGAFAAETASSTPFINQSIEGLIAALAPAKIAELKQALGLLRSRVAMLILSGGITPFHQLSVAQRETLLLWWKTSRVPIFRKLYDSFVKLSVSLYVRSSTLASKAMQYNPPITEPGKDLFDYVFASIDDVKHEKFDAIIVGSGSGGGVVAKELSEAGLKVLIIEKGEHYHSSGPAYNESQALEKMYHGGAYYTNDHGDCAVISGQVFGGGSTVNWAAALQTPASVRRDWAGKHKLPYFETPDFQADLDAVCGVMGVSAPTHNKQNQALLEGARRCGFARADVPQNNGGDPNHGCGHDCANSCRSGGKKGGVHSWLRDAANAGAVFLTGVDVRRIAFNKAKVAEGVIICLPKGDELVISAPRVFVCGGSVESPALLLRSKISNSHIGTSLYLHPTNYVYAVFPEQMYPTEGQILTSVVGEYANLTPSGHGVRVETGIMQPVVGLTLMQWEGGAEHKARLAKHPYMVGCIAIARDRSPGKVRIDNRGEPVVDYTVSAFDSRSVVVGTVAAAECMEAMGAIEIIVAARGVKPWKKGDNFDAWKRVVSSTPPGCYGSAHQMGSNRMASSPSGGACDPAGRVYGVSGVYCADASVLPSASGVNPMVTTMAVARKIARGVIDEIKNPSAARL
jgi:choline dehydrogenase-like flavoprotein